jgi:cell division protein FtsN
MVARLRRAGFEPRVVRTGDELMRVRVGRFATRREAEAERARIQARGIDAIVADNADRERTP